MRHGSLLVVIAALLAGAPGGPAGAAESPPRVEAPRPDAARADAVPARFDAARAALTRGDLARALIELEAVLADLHGRLGGALTECLPPAPAGWRADVPEIQDLTGSAGGGFSVTRAYTREDASLNATVLVDSPAVAAAAQTGGGALPAGNARRVRIGSEEALMRFDPATRSGEVTLVLANRVLLQIEGDGLANADALNDLARGWNLAGIRKLMGL